MDKSNYAPNAMVVTPHHLASQSALSILQDGGTAMEAMVAAAATISVVYPHMCGIAGDGFWLIVPPNGEPFVIEACGAAGSLATKKFYAQDKEIPSRGPKSANTVAGAVGGWREALDYSIECGYRKKSLSKLLADAIRYAEHGYPVTPGQVGATKSIKPYASDSFSKVFISDDRIPTVGEKFQQPLLAETLKKLVEDGLDSFYRGNLAKTIAADMSSVGIPITKSDLSSYHPVRRQPLRLLHGNNELYNLPPPTQGLVSLSILGILAHLKIDGTDEGKFIHHAVEATKIAFELRDKYITDPNEVKVHVPGLLSQIPSLASKIDPNVASKIGKGKGPGDTVWMGVMDKRGFCVSYIQSIYHEFGSGVLLPETGMLWHNRGILFSLDETSILALKPGKKPFHTLNPAAAKLSDGRIMIYGTRGGDGQPQTQAAIFHRYVVQGIPLQASVTLPRWIFGSRTRTDCDTLKLEGRFCEKTVEYLKERGHKVEIVDAFSNEVGTAGALVRHPDGMLEGAFDPRGHGSAVGF